MESKDYNSNKIADNASELKGVNKIFDMLGLFYANKHMYDRLKAQDRKREQEYEIDS